MTRDTGRSAASPRFGKDGMWRRAGARSTRGFTMIEMVVALAIIGVLMIAAIPLLIGYRASRNLDLGAQQLTADLRAAADRARTEHYLILVSFTPASGAYQVQSLSPTNGISGRCALPVAGTWSTVERDHLPSRLTVTSTSLASNELLLSCQGMPYNSTGSTAYTTDQSIVVADSAGSRAVTVRTSGEVACLVTAGGSACKY